MRARSRGLIALLTVVWLTACGAPGAASGPVNVNESHSRALWDGSAVYQVEGQRLAFAGAVLRGPAQASSTSGAMISTRCVALAQGIPYLVAPEAEVMTWNLVKDQLVSTWASDEADALKACPSTLGAGWRLPTSGEASSILERRLSLGAAGAILVSRDAGALALTFSRTEGAMKVEQRQDGLGNVYCVAPEHLLPAAWPERSEIARCIAALSADSFGLEAQERWVLIDAGELDLIELVQRSCSNAAHAATASIVERLSGLVGTNTLRARLEELQAALLASERRVAAFDGALRAVSEREALSCEQLAVLYAQKCPGSCLELQAQHAAHCAKLSPVPRLSAALERERAKLAQALIAVRRQHTLVLAATRAVRCAKGDSEARLRRVLGASEGKTTPGSQGFTRCDIADLECGVAAVQGDPSGFRLR